MKRHIEIPLMAVVYAFLAFWIMCLLMATAHGAPPAPKPVLFYWDKPAGVDTNTVYNLYWTTNTATPTNQWPLLSTITTPTNYSATQYGFYTNLTPGQYFFTLTASNTFWKLESFFSEGAATPPVAQPSQLSGLAIKLP